MLQCRAKGCKVSLMWGFEKSGNRRDTTVGKVIIDSLVSNGIDRVFCVPGESYLGLLDALHDRADIDTLVCRHESFLKPLRFWIVALSPALMTSR
jgi:Thiamine pyrophosphate enzyme, N-terminal TPP binding domain